jgi:hypothetical protein
MFPLLFGFFVYLWITGPRTVLFVIQIRHFGFI